MATYKINGYNLELAFGIHPDQDKSTADSFESLPDVVPGFSRDWGDGVIEYDLAAPIVLKPRVFYIKGTLVANSLDEYQATRMAITTVLYENYVTLEQVESNSKFNAKLRPGGMLWHRLTTLNGKIAVAVQFQFDEVKQNVPFKDNGSENIIYLVDSQKRFYNTQQNQFITT
jgi:hypothetical protein